MGSPWRSGVTPATVPAVIFRVGLTRRRGGSAHTGGTGGCRMHRPTTGYAGGMRDAWSFGTSPLPLVTTAVHAGHDLRPEVAAHIALDDRTRRREEDPFTDRITRAGGRPVIVHRSRFEV